MKLKTFNCIHNIIIEQDETFSIEFEPEGVNAPLIDAQTRGFLINTYQLPNGRMAIGIKLPKNAYINNKNKKDIVILDDPNNSEVLVFENLILTKIKNNAH